MIPYPQMHTSYVLFPVTFVSEGLTASLALVIFNLMMNDVDVIS